MRRAYSLLELLICIAILSILFAILFPVFNKIKIQSMNGVSVSNIKQLGMAWRMYCEDNDDIMMRYITHNLRQWFGDNYSSSYLSNYVDLKKLRDPMSHIVIGPKDWVGYGYNGFYLAPMWGDKIHYPVNYSSINNPSETVVFAPVAGLFTSSKGESLRALGLIVPTENGFPSFHARYNGKSPVLWADLHVSVMKPVYFYIDKRYKKYDLGFLDIDNDISTSELFDLD